jgi:pimeloyl-ACP methyl ester carboxylesterase
MTALADDVLALCDGLGVARPVLVGLSMGGYLAFEVFRRRPTWARGLALCDTRAGADAPEAAAARERFAKDALGKGLGWVAEQMLPKLLRPRARAEDVETVRRRILEGTPEGVAAAQRAMAARPDSTPTLGEIARSKLPVVVLVGAEDGITPPAESRRIADAVPGARLAVLEGAGHLANVEAPAEFAREVSAFLDRCGA